MNWTRQGLQWLAVLTGLLILLRAAGPVSAVTPESIREQPESTPAPSSQPSDGALSEPALVELATLANIVPTRTPLPSPSPDALVAGVAELIEESGLSNERLLWLDYIDWINLAISLLLVVAAYLLGVWVIRRGLPRLIQRTKSPIDDRILQVSGDQLRWLAVVLMLRFATIRLDFIEAAVKTWLLDLYFILALVFVSVILWRLIDLAAHRAEAQSKQLGHLERGKSLITLAVWVLRLGLLLFAITATFSHFAINITGLTLFLGIIGLALSLAGRDMLADIISGVMILIDRPYRIGDRVELLSLNSMGNVYEIGMRSTRILTLNNRMVIVPNSQMGKNQVINYSYPDPSFYDTTELVIAYENDVAQVKQLIINTVQGIEGVQTARTIDALLVELGDHQLRFRIGWWLTTYVDIFLVRDRVNQSVIEALKAAGIVLPYQKGDLRVRLSPANGQPTEVQTTLTNDFHFH
jgi:MscS family membrane protein